MICIPIPSTGSFPVNTQHKSRSSSLLRKSSRFVEVVEDTLALFLMTSRSTDLARSSLCRELCEWFVCQQETPIAKKTYQWPRLENNSRYLGRQEHHLSQSHYCQVQGSACHQPRG